MEKKIIITEKKKKKNKGQKKMVKLSVKQPKKIYKPNRNNADNHKSIKNIAGDFKQLRARISNKTSTYENALLLPELGYNARIPKQYAFPTLTLHRHYSLSVTTNSAGFACVAIDPNFLSDDTSALSRIVVVNDSTYDAASVFPNGANKVPTYTIKASDLSGYRVVSQASTLLPQSSPLNIQGKITGGIFYAGAGMITTAVAGTANTQTAIFGKLSTLSNAQYAVLANVGDSMGVRLISTPVDIRDFEFYPPCKSEADDSTTNSIPFQVFIISGANGAQPFTLEMYYNYEYIPNYGTTNFGQGEFSTEKANPSDVLMHLKMNPSLLAHPTRSDTSYAMSNLRAFKSLISGRNIRLDDFNF